MVTMAGGEVSQAGWACTLFVPEAIDPLTRESGIQTATDQGEFELILSTAGQVLSTWPKCWFRGASYIPEYKHECVCFEVLAYVSLGPAKIQMDLKQWPEGEHHDRKTLDKSRDGGGFILQEREVKTSEKAKETDKNHFMNEGCGPIRDKLLNRNRLAQNVFWPSQTIGSDVCDLLIIEPQEIAWWVSQ